MVYYKKHPHGKQTICKISKSLISGEEPLYLPSDFVHKRDKEEEDSEEEGLKVFLLANQQGSLVGNKEDEIKFEEALSIDSAKKLHGYKVKEDSEQAPFIIIY